MLVNKTVNATNNTSSTIENTDYVQIILYGQSLSQGWECPRAITTAPITGNYMIGDNVLMNYNNGALVLNPLVATKWANGSEQPIVGCVNAFSKMYRDSINPNQKFIGMTCGEGGKTIELLSKECTNSAYNSGYYASTFLKILNNTLQTLPGKTISCPAIIYMQGEDNCKNPAWNAGKGLTSGTDATTDKKAYKALLLKLKNNMQADIMQKYGQKQKPMFFIYQTSGVYTQERQIPISMAQLEFADENDDVVLLNPHYEMPDYDGGHLSTNGYRWYGEMTAKTLYEVLVRKKTFQPVYPEKFTISGRTVTINYHVPVPPLVLDTRITPKIANYGFNLYRDNIALGLSRVQIVDDTTVVITSYTTLTGKVEVSYASNVYIGSGNLRDSDIGTTSMYTYFDDSSDTKKETYTPTDDSGIKLYGKHYPLQNWSVGFYYSFDMTSSGTKDNLHSIKTSIYPNPVKEQLHVTADLQGSQRGKICIYDMLGKLVFGRQVFSSENEIIVDTKHYSPGVYFCMVNVGGLVVNQSKFIVE